MPRVGFEPSRRAAKDLRLRPAPSYIAAIYSVHISSFMPMCLLFIAIITVRLFVYCMFDTLDNLCCIAT